MARPPRAATAPPWRRSRSPDGLLRAGTPRRDPGPRRHRRARRPVRELAQVRRELQGPLPLPRREDALLHGQSQEGHLPLLRLRRGRRRLRLPHAPGPALLPRGGARAGQAGQRGLAGRSRAASRRLGPRRAAPRDGAGRRLLHRARCGPRAASVPAPIWTSAASTPDIARRFGLGWAPEGWDVLLGAMRAQGVAEDALVAAGLVVPRENRPGVYDRFRGRLLFAIRDLQGRVVAFGGRGFGDEQPKYLNSPETPLYSKGSLLYAADLARDTIRERNRALIVEGYVDCLMAHQYGFTETVAALGTAFTADPAGRAAPLLRRGRHVLRRRRRRPEGRRAGRGAAGADRLRLELGREPRRGVRGDRSPAREGRAAARRPRPGHVPASLGRGGLHRADHRRAQPAVLRARSHHHRRATPSGRAAASTRSTGWR